MVSLSRGHAKVMHSIACTNISYPVHAATCGSITMVPLLCVEVEVEKTLTRLHSAGRQDSGGAKNVLAHPVVENLVNKCSAHTSIVPPHSSHRVICSLSPVGANSSRTGRKSSEGIPPKILASKSSGSVADWPSIWGPQFIILWHANHSCWHTCLSRLGDGWMMAARKVV